eukprot:476627_1
MANNADTLTASAVQKHNRKKRTIKNALVNVEDITINSGPDFINWLSLTKTKLKEREIKLMKIRLQICLDTIMSAIHTFTSENSHVFHRQHKPQVHIYVNRMEEENYVAYFRTIDTTTHNIINTFTASITQQLSIWKGYKPTNSNRKSKMNTMSFRDYFKG